MTRSISLRPTAKPFDAYAAPGMVDECGQWKPPRRGSEARFIAVEFERRPSSPDDHNRREDDKSIDAHPLADAATSISSLTKISFVADSHPPERSPGIAG
jgi:hypothetical protein